MVKYVFKLFGLEECPNLNPFDDFDYEISPEGRDFIKDGENSGVY